MINFKNRSQVCSYIIISQIFVYGSILYYFPLNQQMLTKCWLNVDCKNICWILVSSCNTTLRYSEISIEPRNMLDFTNLVKKSLLKSLWKCGKNWKKSIFRQYSKNDFFKNIADMMLIVSVGCNTPLGLLSNPISWS